MCRFRLSSSTTTTFSGATRSSCQPRGVASISGSLRGDAEVLGDAAEHLRAQLAVAQQHLLGEEHAEAAVLAAQRAAVDAA